MEYQFVEFTIKDIVQLISEDRIDLNPSYQRNFIWSPNDQKDLIHTILSGYPLPNFFVYKKPNGHYEMVDGQQRSKTIYRFVNNQIDSSKKGGNIKFDECDQDAFLDYKLPVVLITKLEEGDDLKDFYVLINKKGKHLNSAEVNKSEFHDTNFLRLSSEVLFYQNFINLNLFSEAVNKRMNDRAFVEELIAYLKFGVKDKRTAVEEIYNKLDIEEEEYESLKKRFCDTIDIIYCVSSKIRPIDRTRYKQKSDFYTLFVFVDGNSKESFEILENQYKVLVFLDGKDADGRQYIRPTNEDCWPLKEYALNCVSQSNSKNARDKRLAFFNSVLKNADLNQNEVLIDIINYYDDVYDLELETKEIGQYELLDVEKLIS